MATITVERLHEVEAALTQAGAVKIPAALRRVTVEGAKPLRASIRAAAPVGPTGNLRKSVRYKASRGSRGMRYTIGAFGRGSAHRHLVIYGHRVTGHNPNHTVTGKRTRPNSFVQRGAEAASGAAVAALEAAAAVAITRAV